ncbi:PP0621 family protein [Acidovorax sp. BL-A-41-H1]|uniref:PP0621 family protein n=1 Tax=Acidovorax sp. BL-A-41-H1 TaxID=3421102 RepID=UPI003F7A0EA8
MKYLVLLAVLVVAFGIWRSRRRAEAVSSSEARRPLALPQDMVACAHCGVHVPQADAVVLAGHTFCSAEHRDRGAA